MPVPLTQSDGTQAVFTNIVPGVPTYTVSYTNGIIVCNCPTGYVITKQVTANPGDAPGPIIFDETNATAGTHWTPPWGVQFFRFWIHP